MRPPAISSVIKIVTLFNGNIDQMHLLNFGRLCANLSLMWVNRTWTAEEWDALLHHLALPDEHPWPLPDVPSNTYPGYTNGMAAVNAIYEEC